MAKEDAGDCVFCKILAGAFPLSEVYADDVCVGLMTTEPVNTGHVVVIPRQHYPYLSDMPVDVTGHIFKVGQKLATAIRGSELPCDGINMFVADGEAAEQEVFHFHLHVYPRTSNDGFGFKYDDRHFQKPSRNELNRIATLIKDALPA